MNKLTEYFILFPHSQQYDFRHLKNNFYNKIYTSVVFFNLQKGYLSKSFSILQNTIYNMEYNILDPIK